MGRYCRTFLTIGLLAVLLSLTSADDSRAFQVWRHSDMVGDVLGSQGVGGVTLSYLEQGSRWPDIVGCLANCYCPAWLQYISGCEPDSATVENALSLYHFDNNKIEESIDNLYLTLSIVRSGLIGLKARPMDDTWRDDYEVAMILFGELLHAVQDFYAHSTWIECQASLVGVLGSVGAAPLFRGEQLTCSSNVGGQNIQGLQTGFVDLPVPPGSTTHDALNKDSPGSAQSAHVIRDVLFFTVIANYYEAISGQRGGGSYQSDGLAPRHVIKAWNALFTGASIYDLIPYGGTKLDPMPAAAAAAQANDIADVIALAESDPELQARAQALEDLLAGWDPNDPDAFPLESFDENGLPIDATGVMVPPHAHAWLSQNFPNPFNPVTTIHFRNAVSGHVRLQIFDARGQRVRTLLDRPFDKGQWSVDWDGRNDAGARVPSGAYYYRMTQGRWHESRRMVLVK